MKLMQYTLPFDEEDEEETPGTISVCKIVYGKSWAIEYAHTCNFTQISSFT